MDSQELNGQVGPIDAATLRPLRGLLTAKIVAMVVLIVAALGAGALLAPQVGAGIGFASRVNATVTAIDPLPAEDNAEGGCVRVQVRLSWGDGETGSFASCAADGVAGDAADPANPAVESGPVESATVPDAPDVRVGDSVQVSALAGWRTVVIGPRWPNLVLTAVLLGVILMGAFGVARYRRERAVLAELEDAPLTAEPLPVTRTGMSMAFDVLTMGTRPGGGRGKRAMVHLTFDDPALRPLRVQVPGATAESMEWRRASLYPVGSTRRGTPAGPYVLRTARGVQIAAGRPIRRRTTEAATT